MAPPTPRYAPLAEQQRKAEEVSRRHTGEVDEDDLHLVAAVRVGLVHALDDLGLELGDGRRAGRWRNSVPFIDVEHLIVNKRASGRPQDLADVAALEGP